MKNRDGIRVEYAKHSRNADTVGGKEGYNRLRRRKVKETVARGSRVPDKRKLSGQ